MEAIKETDLIPFVRYRIAELSRMTIILENYLAWLQREKRASNRNTRVPAVSVPKTKQADVSIEPAVKNAPAPQLIKHKHHLLLDSYLPLKVLPEREKSSAPVELPPRYGKQPKRNALPVSGKIALKIDRKTTVYIRPDQDPQEVIDKWKKRL